MAEKQEKPVFKTALAAMAFSAVYACSAAPPAVQAATSEQDIDRALSTPVSKHSQMLDRLEKEYNAVDKDMTVVVLDEERLAAAANLMNGSMSDAVKAYLDKAGITLYQGFEQTLANNVQSAFFPANNYMTKGPGEKLFDARTNSICIITPAAKNIDDREYFRRFINMDAQDNSPYGRMKLRITLAPQEIQRHGNYHEGAHCLDIYYGPRLNAMNEKEYSSPAGMVMQHKEEVFADLVGLGQSLLDGYPEVAFHVANGRSLTTYFVAAAVAGNGEGWSGEELNYSTRAIGAFKKEIDGIGLESYRAMTMRQRREMAYKITETYAMNADELAHLYRFNKEGEPYLKKAPQTARRFLRDYIQNALTAYNGTFAPVAPEN